jgi:hypothetical protein
MIVAKLSSDRHHSEQLDGTRKRKSFLSLSVVRPSPATKTGSQAKRESAGAKAKRAYHAKAKTFVPTTGLSRIPVCVVSLCFNLANSFDSGAS